MINFEKKDFAFLVHFEGAQHYLQDGVYSFPVNSLTLIIDESGMATFRKASNNDVVFSQLINQIRFDGASVDKNSIYEKFADTCTAPVGSDPATTVTDVEVSQDGSQLDFVNESGNTVYSVNMSQYLTDVTITGAALVNGELILYSSNGDAISVDLSEMMSDYYTQTETDAAIDDAVAEETQARITAVQTLEDHVDENAEVTARALNELQENKASKEELQTAIESIDLSGKQDVLTAGNNITIENDVISANQVIELTQAEYDQLVEDEQVDESKIYIITDAPVIDLSKYALTSTTAALQTQVNSNTAAIATKQDALTAGEGITIENGVISAEADLSDYYTKTEIDNAEQATSAALNDLNIRKLDASAYTPVDLTDYATKQELQDAIESIDLSEVENEIAAVSTQVDNNAEVTARALNELQTNKADKSSLADYATKTEVQRNYIDWDDFDSEMVNYATTADTASLQTAINSKADASALDDYATTATTDTLQSQINDKADASALNGYATTATTDNIQSQLTALQTTVAGKAQIAHLTQAQYDALATKDANTIYIIDDATEVNMANYYTKSEIDAIIGNINSILTQINGN